MDSSTPFSYELQLKNEFSDAQHYIYLFLNENAESAYQSLAEYLKYRQYFLNQAHSKQRNELEQEICDNRNAFENRWGYINLLKSMPEYKMTLDTTDILITEPYKVAREEFEGIIQHKRQELEFGFWSEFDDLDSEYAMLKRSLDKFIEHFKNGYICVDCLKYYKMSEYQKLRKYAVVPQFNFDAQCLVEQHVNNESICGIMICPTTNCLICNSVYCDDHGFIHDQDYFCLTMSQETSYHTDIEDNTIETKKAKTQNLEKVKTQNLEKVKTQKATDVNTQKATAVNTEKDEVFESVKGERQTSFDKKRKNSKKKTHERKRNSSKKDKRSHSRKYNVVKKKAKCSTNSKFEQ